MAMKKKTEKSVEKKIDTLSPEDVVAMITKSVENSLSSEDEEEEEKTDSHVAKSIKGIQKQIAALTDLVAKNVKIEKPKSTEEVMADFAKQIQDAISKIGKTSGEEETEEENDGSPESIKKMIEKTIEDTLATKFTKVGKKASGKKSNEEAIDEVMAAIAKSAGVDYNATEDDDDDDEDGDNLDVETHTENGRKYTAKERKAIAELDNFVGKKFEYEAAKKGINLNKDDD